MLRRQFLASCIALPAIRQTAFADDKSYTMSLWDGGWLGSRRAVGVEIELEEGWKTYWRMPGESGIPPEFDWKRSDNAGAITVLYPLPHRFTDASGDTIGYKERVVFPVLIEPVAPGQPIALALDLFFAVCRDVCVPGKESLQLMLTSGDKSEEAHAFQPWLTLVPVPATGPLPVSASTLVIDGDKPALVLTLAKPVADIFVETEGAAYFRKPDFAADGLSARIVIDNVKDGGQLAGKTLKLTIDRDGAGLEQTIMLT